MRRVRVTAPKQATIEEVDLPEPGDGEVRIRPRLVGICGSDLHTYAGNHPFVPLPCTPGHEVFGVVDKIGSNAGAALRTGQRVVLEPLVTCDECLMCRQGRYNLCEKRFVIGSRIPGGLAEYLNVPARRLHPVPDSMSDRGAGLVEPLAIGVHAVRRSGAEPGMTLAVLGGGTIGLMMLHAAKAVGIDTIVVTDLSADKRDRALRLGASTVVDAAAEDMVDQVRAATGERPDIVLDCVGNQHTLRQDLAIAMRGGHVVVVGVPTGELQIPLALVQDREIRIDGTAMYVAEDYRRAIELIDGGLLDEDQLVTATFPMDDVSQAFAAAESGEHVKVHIAVG